MKYLIGLAVLLTLGTAAYFFFIDAPSAPAETAPTVAATIFPLYNIARNIAGDEVEVVLILEPGASAHTFEPAPSTVRKMQNAYAVYSIGNGYDDWIEQIAVSTNTQRVVVDQGIEIRETGEDAHEDEDGDTEDHAHGPNDPHYWLTIENATTIAQTIKSDLVTRFPEHAALFEANLNTYLVGLAETDTFIRTEIAKVENPHIITLHDAWYYFAEAYGLEVVGTFEPTAGREPTPFYLAELTHAVEGAGVSVIYSEPQLAAAPLAAFANDLGVDIREIDPIGGVPGRTTYIELMRYNAVILSQNR